MRFPRILSPALLICVTVNAAYAGKVRAPMPSLKPVLLRCEYLVDPSGIDVREPRLSWVLESTRAGARGLKQNAYQILAASSPDSLKQERGDLWDSGKRESDETAQIVYSGRPLRSRDRVWWKVRVWDQAGAASVWSRPARWSMGLLDPDDWKSVWIEDPAPVEPARPAHNGYHSALAADSDAARWVQIDLGAAHTIDSVRLFPARPYDWRQDAPGFLYPLRFRIDVSDRSDISDGRPVVDRTAEDQPKPGAEPQTYPFRAVTARYVRLTVTRLRERDPGNYAFALAEMQILSGSRILSEGAKVAALDSIEGGGWSVEKLTDGDLTSHPAGGEEARPAPRMRKEFALGSAIRRATVYVTALGVYELRINGRRVGDHILAPEWTDYSTRVQYQTFDATGLLRKGRNALAVQLGDGWYAGRIGMSNGIIGKLRGVYGRKPKLLLQLELERDDGTRQVVATDSSWRSTMDGPIRSSDILDGEVVDTRLDRAGWDSPGFDDNDWRPAELAEPYAGALVAQMNEPIRQIASLRSVARSEPKPGVFIYDLGQNMVGRCRIRVKAPAGAEVTLRHAEALNEDGTLYTANLRGAPQIDRFTLDGGEQTLEPHFTYHGFRYVEVTGMQSPPEELEGIVFDSSAQEVGRFECSSSMLNRLWHNILWTQRANLESVPTDCPQRDERLGWMGDIQAFSQTAIFNMDLASFFTKWARDIRDSQAADGRFPDFAPHPYGKNDRFTGVPAWGDAGVVVPWRCWLNYGDRRILEQQFGAAARWIEYIRSHNPDLIWRNGRGNDYNDWLNGDTLIQQGWPRTGAAVPNEIFATAFFAHSTDIVSRMARALGRDTESSRYLALFRRIKQAFRRAFVDSDGRIAGGTQAGYALALHFDLLPDELRGRAAEHMVAGIRAYHNHISTGIQSTHRMMLELVRFGYIDLAYELLMNSTFPSWGYSIENGATTIWERWDGYVKGRGFQDPGMNSLNHWALGSVGEWIVRVVLGISPDEASPGYRHFVVRPQSGSSAPLNWAKGGYESIAGPISVEWRLQDPHRGTRVAGPAFTLVTCVPPNTAATVYIPAATADSVTESGMPIARARGVRLLRVESGCVVCEVGSGRYTFSAR